MKPLFKPAIFASLLIASITFTNTANAQDNQDTKAMSETDTLVSIIYNVETSSNKIDVLQPEFEWQQNLMETEIGRDYAFTTATGLNPEYRKDPMYKHLFDYLLD